MSVGSGWNKRSRCSHSSGTADESGVELSTSSCLQLAQDATGEEVVKGAPLLSKVQSSPGRGPSFRT